jgi:uncharacterized protein (DUF488 family)
MSRLFTIGFTRTTAESFFRRLQTAGVRKVVDVRLHPQSQLAAFAKKSDLEYFLMAIAGIAYLHAPMLAPTEALFDGIKSGELSWTTYEASFKALLVERKVKALFHPADVDEACLLCACATHEFCHRRLVAEHFAEAWGGLELVHL